MSGLYMPLVEGIDVRDTQVPVTDHVRVFGEAEVRELMRYYRPLLKEIIRRRWDRRMQRRIDPSDALQSTWISVVQGVGGRRFEDRSQFTGFLTRILCNQIENIRRCVFAKKRSVLREQSDGDFYDRDFFDRAFFNERELVDGGLGDEILDRMIREEMIEEVLCAILKLPRELQRLLRWRFRKGMTYAEIAGKLGRKEDEVRYLVDQCVKGISRKIPANVWGPRKPR